MQDVIIQRHSESGFLAAPREVRRKPPAAEQFNWISCAYDVLPVLPEQLELDLSLRDGVILPDDRTVTLLAKEGEGIVVRMCGRICAQIPFMRAQEVVIASRGVEFFVLLEEHCARGISMGCMTSSGKPVASITSPLATTMEIRWPVWPPRIKMAFEYVVAVK